MNLHLQMCRTRYLYISAISTVPTQDEKSHNFNKHMFFSYENYYWNQL